MTESVKAFRISDFGLIGYGYDAIEGRPRLPVADFTYQDPDKIKAWRGKHIAFPDQVIVNDTPKGLLIEGAYSGRMTSARDYQLRLGASLGFEVTDPETDMTLSGAAKDVNLLFRQTSTKSAIEIYDADYDFVYFGLTIGIERCLKPEIVEAARGCGCERDLISFFFDTYGTHLLTRGDIGGHLTVTTFVSLNAETAKDVSQNSLDISAEVRMEDEDYAKGGLNFNERDMRTTSLYRGISSKKVEPIGGNINAPSFDVWSESLRDSDIPTSLLPLGARHVLTPRAVGVAGTSPDQNQNLGLINLTFSSFPDILRRAGIIDERAAVHWAETLGEYLSGRNPFDATPHRLEPDMAEEMPIGPGESVSHGLRGWMATYVTYAGLIGLPGSRALVSCNTDDGVFAESAKMVYAGERIMLRSRTPYLASRLVIKFEKAFGDPDSRLLTENRLVGWFEQPDA